jgi:hypothetical protein
MRYRLPALLLLIVPALAAAADKPAVVELFEDDADTLIPQLTMGGISGGEEVRAAIETEDVFCGKAALRVSPAQRFNPDMKGWSFPIVEKPKEGEYRYLRFAWKKLDAGPIMIQFCSRDPQDWGHRYHAGGGPPWSAREVSAHAPAEWTVLTCDLFKDFGAFTLGGIAFTPLHGGDGLYDHVLLGRTVADLDRATTAALNKTKAKALSDARLKQLWVELGSPDEMVSSSAVWSLVAGRREAIPYLIKSVKIPERKGAPTPVDAATVRPLIEDLNHFRYLTREAAADELFRLGDGVLPHLRKAAESADGQAKARLTDVINQWVARTGLDDVRLRRCAAVLRRVDAPEARELLTRIEKALP